MHLLAWAVKMVWGSGQQLFYKTFASSLHMSSFQAITTHATDITKYSQSISSRPFPSKNIEFAQLVHSLQSDTSPSKEHSSFQTTILPQNENKSTKYVPPQVDYSLHTLPLVSEESKKQISFGKSDLISSEMDNDHNSGAENAFVKDDPSALKKDFYSFDSLRKKLFESRAKGANKNVRKGMMTDAGTEGEEQVNGCSGDDATGLERDASSDSLSDASSSSAESSASLLLRRLRWDSIRQQRWGQVIYDVADTTTTTTTTATTNGENGNGSGNRSSSSSSSGVDDREKTTEARKQKKEMILSEWKQKEMELMAQRPMRRMGQDRGGAKASTKDGDGGKEEVEAKEEEEEEEEEDKAFAALEKKWSKKRRRLIREEMREAKEFEKIFQEPLHKEWYDGEEERLWEEEEAKEKRRREKRRRERRRKGKGRATVEELRMQLEELLKKEKEEKGEETEERKMTGEKREGNEVDDDDDDDDDDDCDGGIGGGEGGREGSKGDGDEVREAIKELEEAIREKEEKERVSGWLRELSDLELYRLAMMREAQRERRKKKGREEGWRGRGNGEGKGGGGDMKEIEKIEEMEKMKEVVEGGKGEGGMWLKTGLFGVIGERMGRRGGFDEHRTDGSARGKVLPSSGLRPPPSFGWRQHTAQGVGEKGLCTVPSRVASPCAVSLLCCSVASRANTPTLCNLRELEEREKKEECVAVLPLCGWLAGAGERPPAVNNTATEHQSEDEYGRRCGGKGRVVEGVRRRMREERRKGLEGVLGKRREWQFWRTPHQQKYLWVFDKLAVNTKTQHKNKKNRRKERLRERLKEIEKEIEKEKEKEMEKEKHKEKAAKMGLEQHLSSSAPLLPLPFEPSTIPFSQIP
ncbi:uncharacterized protein MONOS_15617 [Monocercomonoides exilis]|uniref:uncharacterized protein n=1 Tax=Monocercomonoides exilis TaxID=2049356 RepID=UPI003559C97D|nr:hypothetical protein MONOS_15617 [Monocercomonoides exilis]